MQTYQINSSRVVYEILNSEVIAIDFNTGNYYALVHVAKQVWQLIEKQVAFEEMIQLLVDRYQCDADKVTLDMQQFIAQLLEDGLIIPVETMPSTESIDLSAPGWEYDAPTVQKYTEVQSLLLLDPIHEVTEAGWPEKLESLPSNH